MSNNEDSILEESLAFLQENHGGNQGGLQTFNRLLFKSKFGRDPQPDERLNIQKNQIRSTKENWSTEKLRNLQQSHPIPPHDRDKPRNEDIPIIIVKYEGMDRLLDGSNRINKWFNVGNTEMHDVNMHEIIQTPFSKTS